MVIIQIECEDAQVVEVLEAIKAHSRNPKIFAPIARPNLPSVEREFETRALAIANAIKPRPNQPMRLETLEFVLNSGDTWSHPMDTPDQALRNATGALSKALRRFAPFEESPLEILCERRREVVPSGPYKGRYQSTHYIPTKLGKRVREILEEKGVLKRR